MQMGMPRARLFSVQTCCRLRARFSPRSMSRSAIMFMVVHVLGVMAAALQPSRRAFLAAAVPAVALRRPALAAPAPPGSLIASARGFYSAWNDKDVEKAMGYMADSITFVDAQYPRPFSGSAAVRAYLQDCADSLPGWAFIIDDFAEDAERRRLGLRWHVEDSSRLPLPFPTDGLSMLEFDASGRITVARDMVEPTVKAGELQLPLLRAVSKILGIR